MDEQNLIERLKHGDMAAFTYLVDVYQHKVLATCHRFLFIDEDAEDVDLLKLHSYFVLWEEI